jgi:hypothetical protein
MSDTRQGNDWWQASDGKWYPPGPAGNPAAVPASTAAPAGIPTAVPMTGPPPATYAPVPPSPGYAAAPPGYGTPPPGYGAPAPAYGAPANYRPKTSALAVFALIFSIVWILGVGSVLAVLFGILALVVVGRSQGRKRGRGLAIAGIIIGVIGIAGSLTMGYFALKLWHWSSKPHTEMIGKQVTVGDSVLAGGIDKLTVLGVNPDAAGRGINGVAVPAPSGEHFVSAQLELCQPLPSATSGTGHQLSSPFHVSSSIRHFFIQTATGKVYGAVGTSTGTPNLASTTRVGVNGCETGYLTFAVPASETPATLRYDPWWFFHFTWSLPGS